MAEGLILSVEFVDHIQLHGVIHIGYWCCGNSCPASTEPSAVIAGTRSDVTNLPF